MTAPWDPASVPFPEVDEPAPPGHYERQGNGRSPGAPGALSPAFPPPPGSNGQWPSPAPPPDPRPVVEGPIWQHQQLVPRVANGAMPVPNHPPYEAQSTGAPMPPSTGDEEWVFVDPSTYSDPYTSAPVYTSGPPTAPTATPPTFVPEPPHPPPPVGTPPTELGIDASAPDYPPLAVDHQPEKGELKIKERRTWKTWQLLIGVLLAAGIGMWFNGNSGSASGTGSSSGSSSYKLPPPTGSSTTPGAAGGSSTSTTAGSTSTTSAAGSTSTTTGAGASSTATTGAVAVGPATVLVPETQQTGNWTSPVFTIAGGTWNIGWAFQCAPAPAGGPSFQIFAVTSGASPGATPAVTSTAASGQAVTPLTSVGSQQVIVQTTAACRWAVKVTGSST